MRRGKRPTRKTLRLSTGILFGLVLTAGGCSALPSETEGERYLNARIDEGSEERLVLERFKKLDGREGEVAGVGVYTMMFSATAAFKADALYTVGAPLINEGSEITTAEFRSLTSRAFSWDNWLAAGFNGYREAQSGDRLLLEGTISFERRESGWVPISSRFTFAPDTSARAERAAANAR